MRSYVVVFASVLLAELGDKTQLATLLFATNPAASKLGVFVAAAGALVASSALAVVAGASVAAWIPPERLKAVAGISFIVIGVWLLLSRS